MSIKNRIGKLECQNDSAGTGLGVFQTLFASDGIRVHIIWGRGNSSAVERQRNEALTDYKARVEDLGKLPWKQALKNRL
ncbi:MAG: hypothetical protein AB3N12_01325 [Ruegeria sp.]